MSPFPVHFHAIAWLGSLPPDDLRWESRASWSDAAHELRREGWIPNGVPPAYAPTWARARQVVIIREEEHFERMIVGDHRYSDATRFLPARSSYAMPWDGHDVEWSADARGHERWRVPSWSADARGHERWRVPSAADGRFWIPTWTLDVAEMYLPTGIRTPEHLWLAQAPLVAAVLNTLAKDRELRLAVNAVVSLADDAGAYQEREERLAAARALVEPKISG